MLCFALLIGCSEEPKAPEEDALDAGTVITPDEEPDTTQEEEPEDANQETTSEENFDTEPLPTTMEELAKEPQGEYAREIYNNKDGVMLEGAQLIEALGENAPSISEQPTEAEIDHFFRESLKLVQDDFIGEEEILTQLKFQLLGTPEVEDPRYAFKEQLNISILLDASGSMAQPIGNKTKMDVAKETITAFMEELPSDANVALRVFGHEGTGADSDKALSCSSSDIIYGFDSYDKAAFAESLSSVKPAGWTPNGLALQKAQEDLQEFDGENNTNIVYLVSDGIETCETEPVKVAKTFYDSNIQPIINVIGFDVDGEGQNHLKEIATAAEGIYQTVKDQKELAAEFDKINDLAEAWATWKEKGMEKLELKEVQNSIDIFGYETRNGQRLWEEETSLEHLFEAYLTTNKITEETYKALRVINDEYHDAMRVENKALKEKLYEWNENSFKDAIAELEKKYDQNQE